MARASTRGDFLHEKVVLEKALQNARTCRHGRTRKRFDDDSLVVKASDKQASRRRDAHARVAYARADLHLENTRRRADERIAHSPAPTARTGHACLSRRTICVFATCRRTDARVTTRHIAGVATDVAQSLTRTGGRTVLHGRTWCTCLGSKTSTRRRVARTNAGTHML